MAKSNLYENLITLRTLKGSSINVFNGYRGVFAFFSYKSIIPLFVKSSIIPSFIL